MDVVGTVKGSGAVSADYVAAYDLISSGEIPDLGPAVRQVAVTYAGSAAAGACTAIGAAPAAPLCQYVGGEIAAWVIDEAWPVLEDFFVDVGAAVADFFGFGDDAREEDAKRRARQRAVSQIRVVGTLIQSAQTTAWQGFMATVGGLELLARKLGLTALAPYGYVQVVARLRDIHGLRLTPYAPGGWLAGAYRGGADELIPPGAPGVPEWFRGSEWAVSQHLAPGVPNDCFRNYWTAGGYRVALFEQALEEAGPGEPEDRDTRALWIICAGGPMSATGNATKAAAAGVLTDAIIGWMAQLQRAGAAEAALLVQLAAGLEAVRVASDLAAAESEMQASTDAQYQQERERYAYAQIQAANTVRAELESATAGVLRREKSGAGIVLVLAASAVAAGGAAWWISRRARRRRRA